MRGRRWCAINAAASAREGATIATARIAVGKAETTETVEEYGKSGERRTRANLAEKREYFLTEKYSCSTYTPMMEVMAVVPTSG